MLLVEILPNNPLLTLQTALELIRVLLLVDFKKKVIFYTASATI